MASRTSRVEKAHKYVPPECPKSGYSFVAAATLYRNFGGIGAYIKYKGGPTNKITIKEQSNTHVWFVCPDREIVIVRNNHFIGQAFYPWADSFDAYVDFTLFHDDTSKGIGIEYIMTNYAHSAGSKNSRLPCTLEQHERIQVLSDSGGLQLARGVKDVIHPKTLIEFYNNNADAGMVLDLPLFFSDPAIAKKAALQQKKNVQVMLDNSKGVELINIFHGQTIEEREMFRSIVETPQINRVAIGGIANRMPVSATNAICETLGGKQKYKQYHVLGIYTAELVPLMVKLANSGLDVHITSDSTSHIQSASNKAYHFQFDVYHNMKRIAIGNRASFENTCRTLPCQCPVCSTIKYMDILGFGSHRYVMELLSIHNAYEMMRYAKGLEEFCLNHTSKDYNRLVEQHVRKSSMNAEMRGALDFIDLYAAKGLKAAQNKYGKHLNNRKTTEVVVNRSLFSTEDPVQDRDEDRKKAAILKQLELMALNLKKEV